MPSFSGEAWRANRCTGYYGITVVPAMMKTVVAKSTAVDPAVVISYTGRPTPVHWGAPEKNVPYWRRHAERPRKA